MSGAFRGAAALPQPKKLISNGAMAAVLASFVGLSYYWSMYAVGGTDLEKEVQLEVRPGFLCHSLRAYLSFAQCLERRALMPAICL